MARPDRPLRHCWGVQVNCWINLRVNAACRLMALGFPAVGIKKYAD